MGDTATETGKATGDSAPLEKLSSDTIEFPNPEIVQKEVDSMEFGGLFEDEAKPSEAELKGEEEAPKDEGTSQETPKEGEKGKAADSEPAGDKKAEEKKEEKPAEKKEADKPPEGFVPHGALHEERMRAKALREEVDSLKAEIATLKAKPPKEEAPSADEAEWKDFKILSKEEFNELLDDDPSEAVRYQAKLSEYKDFQRSKKEAEAAKAQAEARTQSLISQWTNKIAETVPGIYDEGSEVGPKLATFAEENGFDDPSYLEAMTDPRTLIVPYGHNQTYLMGPGAAALLKFLHNAHSKLSGADPGKLRDEIAKELRPKIVEEVTKELTAKLKGAKAGDFTSLTSVPGSGGDVQATGPLTEEQWSKLSPEERDKYLRETSA